MRLLMQVFGPKLPTLGPGELHSILDYQLRLDHTRHYKERSDWPRRIVRQDKLVSPVVGQVAVWER
jgi:hypothetical protein